MTNVGVLKTLENELLLAAIALVQECKGASNPLTPKRRDELTGALQTAAIKYARYFVAKECAALAKAYSSEAAAAIRAHGGKHPADLDWSALTEEDGQVRS